MGRGFDSQTAEQLVNQGHTLNSLKAMSTDDLRALNIPEKQIQIILDEPRPPIPQETVNKVLYDSRWTCCICRDRTQGIIIHHIHEYSESRNHSEDNLVVLCLNHHGEAHTKRELQINLTPDRLRDAKKQWLDFAQEQDLHEALSQSPGYSYSFWDYFNHRRVIDLSRKLEINLGNLPHYSKLLSEEQIHEDGTPVWKHKDLSYMYDSIDRTVYSFYSSLLERIMERAKCVKLYPDKWNHTFVNAMLREDTMIVCKGAFTFKQRDRSQVVGPGQFRDGLRRSSGIHIRFSFDAWEATSSSGWASHLCGRKVVTAVCLIRSKSRDSKNLVLDSSVLAIGNGFGPPHYTYEAEEAE